VQGKAPKEIHTILTEILACFLAGRAKDLSAPLYNSQKEYFGITMSLNIRVLKLRDLE
jgi:hypothetical protein